MKFQVSHDGIAKSIFLCAPEIGETQNTSTYSLYRYAYKLDTDKQFQWYILVTFNHRPLKNLS